MLILWKSLVQSCQSKESSGEIPTRKEINLPSRPSVHVRSFHSCHATDIEGSSGGL